MPNYEVPEGKVMTLAGPANVTIKGGEMPIIVDSLAELEAAAPVLASLDPTEAELGGEDFSLVVTGDNLTASSVLVFAGQDEPTTLSEDGASVSTLIAMAYWHGPDTIEVKVRNGPAYSNALDFTFTDPGAAARDTKSEHGHHRRKHR
jgi:hypothetical protein